MVAYAEITDLYRQGFPRGLLANPGRSVAEVSATTNLLTLDGHGFADDDELLFRVEDGGEMPAPLVAGTTYYAIASSDSTFQVALTAGGAAVDLTTPGESVVVSTSLDPAVAATLEHYSRLADTYLIGHEVPLTAPYPAVVVGFVAKLAAAALLELMGQASEQVRRTAEKVEAEFKRLAKGIPLRDAAATASANLPVVVTGVAADTRGWSSYGCDGGETLP
jgi:hypothetical protein